MKTRKFALLVLTCIVAVTGCTSSGEFYDADKHTDEDFSVGNTILSAAGAGLLIFGIVKAAQNGGRGGYAPTDYDWDWDYLPANNRWVCRGIQTGQFAALDNCAHDLQDDDRWPNQLHHPISQARAEMHQWRSEVVTQEAKRAQIENFLRDLRPRPAEDAHTADDDGFDVQSAWRRYCLLCHRGEVSRKCSRLSPHFKLFLADPW